MYQNYTTIFYFWINVLPYRTLISSDCSVVKSETQPASSAEVKSVLTYRD
jgi:hypothetical protein